MFPENAAHLHLMLNHLPLFGFALGAIALTLALVWNSRDATRLSLVLLSLSAFATVPVYLSGGPAADVIMQGVPGLNHPAMDVHQASAFYSLLSIGMAGALAVVGLILSRGGRAPGRKLSIAILLMSLTATGFVARTSELGGRIHHPESYGRFTISTEGETEHHHGF